jgi:hypothetical protein
MKNIEQNSIIEENLKRLFDGANWIKNSKNKDILDSHSFTFPEETYGIRIRVNTNQVNYEKNKGRVVLGDMSLIHLV